MSQFSKDIADYREKVVQIRHYIEIGGYLDGTDEVSKRCIRKNKDKYMLKDGVLYYYTRSKNLVQVLTAEDEILNVLSQCHSNMVGGGHTGILTTREKVGSRYFWKNWCKHVEEYVSTCQACQKFEKVKTRAPQRQQNKVSHEQSQPLPAILWQTTSSGYARQIPLTPVSSSSSPNGPLTISLPPEDPQTLPQHGATSQLATTPQQATHQAIFKPETPKQATPERVTIQQGSMALSAACKPIGPCQRRLLPRVVHPACDSATPASQSLATAPPSSQSTQSSNQPSQPSSQQPQSPSHALHPSSQPPPPSDQPSHPSNQPSYPSRKRKGSVEDLSGEFNAYCSQNNELFSKSPACWEGPEAESSIDMIWARALVASLNDLKNLNAKRLLKIKITRLVDDEILKEIRHKSRKDSK